MELFKINEDYLVELNKEWISTIKEFKKLITRDKDRFKKQAQKEFTFIYHYCDYSSQFSSYPEDERLNAALNNSELDCEPKVIFKDADFMAAIDKYNELKETRSLRVIKNSWKAIDALSSYLELVTINDPSEANNLMGTLSKLGGLIDSVKKIETQVKAELQTDAGLRGNSERGIDEIPE